MTPSWYDVLDVDDDASTEEIRTAWRASVADLDPTDRRFRSLNKAAEVLLDPQRRAAHDATLAAERATEDADDTGDADTDDGDTGGGGTGVTDAEPPSPAEALPDVIPDAMTSRAVTSDAAVPAEEVSPSTTTATGRIRRRRRATATVADSAAASAPADPADATDTTLATETTDDAPQSRGDDVAGPATAPATESRPSARPRLVVLTAVLAVLAVLLMAATVAAAVRRPHDTLPDAGDVAAAQAAAETAIVPVLSYDYRHLPASEAAATSYMTPAYAGTYRSYFAATVQNNAGPTKTVVTADVVDSGIVRTGPGRVDVLLFVNQPQVNKAGRRTEYNQVTARMVDDSGRWLVSCLITTLNGVCGRP